MSFTDAVRHCLANYANFTGRARRSEYWFFMLALVLLNIAASILDAVLLSVGVFLSISLLAMLATLVPAIAVATRRLHDVGRSGWWQLVVFVPLVGWIIALVWFARAGDPGPNRFGPPPGHALAT
jgi:uncharacterized membrane protein YhaH (DUF805 family)